eukprot:5947317-Pleurochrysis_carterae.AAC.1
MSAVITRFQASASPSGYRKKHCKLSNACRSWIYDDTQRYGRSPVRSHHSFATLLWPKQQNRNWAHISYKMHLGIFIECARGDETRCNI